MHYHGHPIRRLPPDEAPHDDTMGLRGHPRSGSKEKAITAAKLVEAARRERHKGLYRFSRKTRRPGFEEDPMD